MSRIVGSKQSVALFVSLLGIVPGATVAPLRADAPYLSSVLAVEVGHWLEVRGELAADGRFEAQEAELQPTQKRVVLIGTVAADQRDGRRFGLLGRTVTTDSATEWRGVASQAIAGARVKVEGVVTPEGELVAETIAARGAGRDRVGGRVDALDRVGERVVARIQGFEVLLPAAVEHELPLEQLAPSAQRDGRGEPGSRYLAATRDEDDLFGDGVALGASTRLTGQVELDTEAARELDLDAEEDQDESNAALRGRVRLDWEPDGRNLSAALELRAQQQWTFADAGDESAGDLTLGEAYVAFEDLAGGALELVVGRQDFDDDREWIYDENLDAVRLLAGGERVRFELAAGTLLFDGSEREESVTTYVAQLSNTDRKRRLGAWAMVRDFDLVVPERTTHVGVRAGGRWIESTEGWFEAALFRGERGAVDLEGWGLDLGLTWKPEWMTPFSFTVGYALGSGGEVTDTEDATFRQTGLHDNNAKFAGVTSFRYYGELVDPELANLRVVTAGVGMRFGRKSSLDLVGHLFEQDSPRRRLIETDLDRRADGVHTDLGWEADLILGSRERSWLDLELVAAYFEPGAAFPVDAKSALLGKFQLRVRY